MTTLKDFLDQTNLDQTEAEILLAHILGKDRSFLHAFPETKLKPKELKEARHYFQRREKGEPLPYILGFKEFYGRNFYVDQNVFIPRHDTEEMVELVLKFARGKKLLVAEVGTGSGAISITLAKEAPHLQIIAGDISPQALRIAQKNSRLRGIEGKINFFESDLLTNTQEEIDLVVANLPYIPTTNWEKLPSEIKDFEPRLALDSGKSAMTLYEKLFTQAKKKKAKDIFYEVDGKITHQKL